MGSSGPADREPVTRLDPVEPSYQPTYVPPRPSATDVVPPRSAADVTSRVPVPGASHQPATIVMHRRAQAAAGPQEPVTHRPPPDDAPPSAALVRHGPGVPVSQAGVPVSQAGVAVGEAGVPVGEAGVAAESVWRTGQRPGPPPRQGRWRGLRRVLGVALTAALLIAAGVVVWLRFFDHPPFHVTQVAITQRAKAGCEVNVTGRIETNGAAGTISYQWVFRPQTQAPQPLNQSVVAGQHAVYVTVAVQGQGHGTATQTVTLDVLGPDPGTASANVTVSC